jgi:hypothetical protein
MSRSATFHQLLGNNLVANITNFRVWFGSLVDPDPPVPAEA